MSASCRARFPRSSKARTPTSRCSSAPTAPIPPRAPPSRQLAARDPRVRYLELPERPNHPSHPWSFWETTGLRAANRALDGARGRFIAPLDHDDEFTATHIADLVARAREERADLVHAQALCEQRTGPPTIVGRERLAHGHVCHGAVLYSDRLAHMRYDTACWLLEEPGDWNMWRRMQELGRERRLPRPRRAAAHRRARLDRDARRRRHDALRRRRAPPPTSRPTCSARTRPGTSRSSSRPREVVA